MSAVNAQFRSQVLNTEKENDMNRETMTIDEVKAITVDRVYEVYSGKPGCACGCRGTYKVHPLHVPFADKHRGYPHDAEDVNLTQVKKVLRIVQENFKDGITDNNSRESHGQCSLSGEFASVTIQTGYDSYRVYTVYVLPAEGRS